jgi:phage tail sheath protein FI
MSNLLSPGVQVKEFDLSTTIQRGGASATGVVGEFEKGPINEIVLITSEDQFISIFGRPTNKTYNSFFTVTNFLKYSSTVQVVRCATSEVKNSYNGNGYSDAPHIMNEDRWTNNPPTQGTEAIIVARSSGIDGNNISVKSTINGTDYNVKVKYTNPINSESAIVEEFNGSSVEGSKDYEGSNNFIDDIIFTQSNYIYYIAGSAPTTDEYEDLNNGQTANIGSGIGDWTTAWDVFKEEGVDVNILIAGAVTNNSSALVASVSKHVVELAEFRKDCIAIISPPRSIVVGKSATDAATDLVTWREGTTFNVNSSYGFLEGNYKQQYDKYNDVLRWVSLGGDIGGCFVTTDTERDPWWSPAGLSRGQIKGVIKLAYNPNQTVRDILYESEINPVVSFPGDGVVLWGDKTLQSTASSFDRINVRRLFIVLESTISDSAKSIPFNFNDSYTRAEFTGTVTSFMESVKVRRGVTEYMVVCDETNNTSDIIDANQFIASIFVKPNKSINFITLNFVATRTGVDFSEAFGAI